MSDPQIVDMGGTVPIGRPPTTTFSDAIDKHAEELANDAKDHRSELTVQADRDGVEAEISTKLGTNWSLGAWAKYAYNGSWNAAAQLKAWWGK